MALIDNIQNYWKLDESSGNASDSAGSSTLTNNNSATYSTGVINNGVYLNGSNQYLSGTIADIDSYASGWSTAGWVYWSAYSASKKWFFTIPESAGWGTCFIGNNDGGGIYTNFVYKIGTGTPSVYGVDSGVAIPVGTWFHIALTLETGGVRRLYLNGTQVHTHTSGNPANNSTNIRLGAEGASFRWNGRMDEWGIWGRTLSAGEVSELYNSGAGLQYPFTIAPTATPMMHHMAISGGLM
jgi:hypothetical protein